MKRFLFLFAAVAAVICSGSCSREQEGDVDSPLVFSDVPVNIGQEDGSELLDADTRSLIHIDSESFVCAYLFAFDASSKKILCYPTEWEDHQGEQGGPVAKFTTSKTFNWALPVGKDFDIWVVVNPGTSLVDFLESALVNSDLSESDLYGSNMVFTCPSSSALKSLDVSTDGTGIPMSGRMDNQRISSADEGITITVKRLFAKYNIRFDVSDYVSKGYTVNAFSIRGSKSNTEVPFFWNGDFAQTDRSKLNVLDFGTASDLVDLNDGEYVTLYFLENCQGTKSGVSDWNTVYNDLNASDPSLDLCSYIEVAVNVTKPATSGSTGSDAVDESFIHRVYVGESFLDKSNQTYNFDVRRNLFKQVKIYLKKTDETESFKFTNTNSLSVEPSRFITVPFVCERLTEGDLSFTSSDPSKLEYKTFVFREVSREYNGKTYPYSGTVTFRAALNANGTSVTITGGKKEGGDYVVWDKENVRIEDAVVFELSRESLTLAKGFPLTLDVIKGRQDIDCSVSVPEGLASDYGFTVTKVGGNLSSTEYPSRYIDRYEIKTSYSEPVSNPLVSMGVTYSSYPVNNFASIPVTFTSSTGVTKTLDVSIHKNPVILDYDFSQVIQGGNMRLHVLADFDLPDNTCLVYDLNGKVVSDCVYTVNYTLGRKGLYVKENPFNISARYVQFSGNETAGKSESPSIHSPIEEGFYTFNIQSSSILNQYMQAGNGNSFTSYTGSLGQRETVWSVPSRIQLNMNVGFAIVENGTIVKKLNDVDLRYFNNNSCNGANYYRNLLYSDQDSSITVDYAFTFIGIDQYSYTTRSTEYVTDGYDFEDYSHVLKYKVSQSPAVCYRTLVARKPDQYARENLSRFLSDYVVWLEFGEPTNWVEDPVHTVSGYNTGDFYEYTYVKSNGSTNTSGGLIECNAGLNIVHSCPSL